MDEVINVFIGWDPREVEAYEVCKESIIKRCSVPVHVQPLNQKALRYMGLYRRAPEENSRVDVFDRKPFSTQFTFTRFLVPHLMQFDGWALFCDCDFLFLDDLAKLWLLKDPQCAVQVVKHEHKPKDAQKMDHVQQSKYPRKNWSSLILWNCGHEGHKRLTTDAVNTSPGVWLHGFHWLENHMIGSLPHGWNWLEGGECVGCSEEIDKKAIHYTRGGPWFEEYKNVRYADLWLAEQRKLKPERGFKNV